MVLFMYKSGIYYNIDAFYKDRDNIVCVGWAFSEYGDVDIVHDDIVRIERKKRPDVVNFYQNKKVPIKCGFYIYFRESTSNFHVCINDGRKRISINVKKINKRYNSIKYLKSKMNYNSMTKALSILSHEGFYGIVKKIRKGYKQIEGVSYQQWYLSHSPTLYQLSKQKEEKFHYSPLISIVTPVYNTPKSFLKSMIESVQSQTYANWELCIVDASTNNDTYDTIKSFALKDPRIKVKRVVQNKGISGNSNIALEMASGEYIALLDHDDLLTPDALYEVITNINKDRNTDLLYSDEDKTDETGTNFFDPYFKPDFSIDLLRSYNYICHFLVIKNSLFNEAGKYFCREMDGAQDYDLILRCIEKTKNIKHITRVLYHWRVYKNSTAASASAKPYTHIAGKRALAQHLHRLGIKANVIDAPTHASNQYKILYTLTQPPFVSIIIPTCDHINDLKKCVKSILDTINYEKYEILIVENNSKQKETFNYYNSLKSNRNIRVMRYPFGFNYSAINNWAIKHAKGEYIVLMNNDIELISYNWLHEMLSYCQRDDVGIVGSKLYYPDQTIQHAGVIIGMGGVADHAFKGAPKNYAGYFDRAMLVQNLSAVTAALLMIKRNVFDSIGGFDENLAVAFNDVDLCLKTRKNGFLIVFDPDVEAYHYESKSRGYEDTPEKKRRFHQEHNYFYKKWGKHYIDPYYNPNLTLKKNDFSLNLDNV